MESKEISATYEAALERSKKIEADIQLHPERYRVLTGDRPTGRLHIGHYVGSLRRRVELQNSGAFDRIFIMIADAQALTDNADKKQEIQKFIAPYAPKSDYTAIKDVSIAAKLLNDFRAAYVKEEE